MDDDRFPYKNLTEYVHSRCGGRLRVLWPNELLYPSGCSVICEKCRMLWDDLGAASSFIRAGKGQDDNNLIKVKAGEYGSPN